MHPDCPAFYLSLELLYNNASTLLPMYQKLLIDTSEADVKNDRKQTLLVQIDDLLAKKEELLQSG
ncbi:hypothetical protein IRB23M11_13250 [Alkalibacterium sp. m-11]